MAKQTVATILREYKVIQDAHIAQQQELDALMSGGLTIEHYCYWLEKKRDEEQRLEKEALEQRKLDAKLTAERIAQKTRERQERNYAKAHELRQEQLKLKLELETQHKLDLEAAKGKKEQVNALEQKTHVSVANHYRQKELFVKALKEESQHLRQQGFEQKSLEEAERKDKIQRIKATTAIRNQLKNIQSQVKQLTTECRSAEIKARMQKALNEQDEEKKMTETRLKLKSNKAAKQAKVQNAMQHIQAFRFFQKQMKCKSINVENSHGSSTTSVKSA